ncbi:hypothetical protein jhhlp_004645 [Lomentospora prolificans]|uniref:Major facilitator superfamily (MFS) profile domain-containing protein n=1 Tax=Lomentospora prolificans TaxID=41688 RepID=A0A2N3NC52_9PEZI|nr:hypothetical protein jhhlp_004645 [Lomentospora prolificans]
MVMGQDETSPLLSSRRRAGQNHGAVSAPDARPREELIVDGVRSTWYLALLSVGIGGLQVAWSVDMSSGSPYLLSLGMSKVLLAFVRLAGPVMGIVVQPYVGMLSDNARFSWGRRRPFVVAGTIWAIASIMFLAWVREIVGAVAHRDLVKAAAFAAVYSLEFGLNTIEPTLRALIIDCAPNQQEAANGMASRSIALGNIIGFLAGSVDLTAHLPWWFGDTQFKALCAFASLVLAGTIIVTILCVREVDPNIIYGESSMHGVMGLQRYFKETVGAIGGLSKQIRTLCTVQLFACFAFYPVLFYASVYVAEIFVEPHLKENPHMNPEELDRLYEKGTREGTAALSANAVLMLATTVLGPLLVEPTYDSEEARNEESAAGSRWGRLFRIPGFTLKRAWIISLVLMAGILCIAPFVEAVELAVALVALLGYTWAIFAWAPFAIIGADRREAEAAAHFMASERPLLSGDDEDRTPPRGPKQEQAGAILGIHNMAMCTAQLASTGVSLVVFGIWQQPRGTPGDQSLGIVLGISGLAAIVSVWLARGIRERPETGPVGV